MSRNKLLTKSNYLVGLQCPKYLWIKVNEKGKIPAPDRATLHRFDEGYSVNELAKKIFPAGTDIPIDDFTDNIRQTKELIARRKLSYEAGILCGDIYSRVDILNPASDGAWDIIEVKSSTAVKTVHIDDVSFQKHCCEKAGLKIRKCFLMHVNKNYVKQGEINPEEFLDTEDITAEVDAAMRGTEQRIDSMFKIVVSKRCLDTAIGKQCRSPYECPLKEYCWKFLPSENIFTLYYGGRKSFELFEKGIYSIKDIPADVSLTKAQKIQKECELTGEPYIHKNAFKNFLDTLKHPLYYLDFETFNPCIPIFDNARPYQNIPFQFSLHVIKDEDSEIEHYGFLADGSEDPRPELLTSLKNMLGNKGSIIVYNQAFEKNVLTELGEAFPDYKEWVDKVLNRIKDLLASFQSFAYYHPEQKGSASLKKVLPLLTGKSYEGMNISNGGDASFAFLEMACGNVSDEQRDKTNEELRAYCSLDTEGMVLIVKKAKELIAV